VTSDENKEDRIQNTEDSRQNERPKANHESTKLGKHEKMQGCLSNPLFFRAFVPAKLTAGKPARGRQASCFVIDLGFDFVVLSATRNEQPATCNVPPAAGALRRTTDY